MILLLTSTQCVTTNLLLNYLRGYEVFRFNIDRWRDYSWSITANGYRLEDPIGRVCEEEQVGAVYFRKLFFDPIAIDVPANGCEESWLREEVKAIWKGIMDLADAKGKLALVHPSPSGEWLKMRQMRAAAPYFEVPAWQMLHRAKPCAGDSIVCKSNTGAPTGKGFFTVSHVEPARLHPEYPWFIQQAVDDATHDVTIAYVNGKVFAYRYDRSKFSGTMDSRKATYESVGEWEPFSLPEEDVRKVNTFMRKTGFSFARLDFLLTPHGLVFLEMNTNGQYAWLDLYGENGLLKAIADEIIHLHDANMSSPKSSSTATSPE